MKKSLFVLFLYSSLLTASEIAYRFVFGIETLPAAKMAETFALTFVIAALYLFARYKATRLLIAVFFAFSIIANNVHYAVYQSWMTGINYWLMLKEVTEVGSAGASMLDKLWLPALWGVAEVVLFCSLAKFRRKTHFFCRYPVCLPNADDFRAFVRHETRARYFAQTDIQPHQSQLFQLRLFCRTRVAVSVV